MCGTQARNMCTCTLIELRTHVFHHVDLYGGNMANILDEWESEIRQRVLRGDTLESVSLHLQALFPNVRGLSTQCVTILRIHYRSTLRGNELDSVVRQAVLNIGHSYGRWSLHGLLRSEGVHVSQRRLGASLDHTFPFAQSQEPHSWESHESNSISCYIFRGKNLLGSERETGYVWSGAGSCCRWLQLKIVGFSTMPQKNPITIYGAILPPLL